MFIGEDANIPFRYVVNAKREKEDKFFELNCDLTGPNYTKILRAYTKIYDRCFEDAAVR